jgi:hypothetical protein
VNIFDQYGIKEVADVTLYAIELDKNDDEIYVPVLYFDTLKVSTVEQTAEQTSARGGLGNPELIMWDYGKEISVTLEDALYTPASQSLMWGGKFGTKNSKIYGVWNPYVYPKDRYGRTLYLKKEVVSLAEISSNIITGYESLFVKIYDEEENSLLWTYNFDNIGVFIDTNGNKYIKNNDLVKNAYTKLLKAAQNGLLGQDSSHPSTATIVSKIRQSLSLIEDEENSNSYFSLNEKDSLIDSVINNDDMISCLDIINSYLEEGYVIFECPCDGEIKLIRYVENDGVYKYLKKSGTGELEGTSSICPLGKEIFENEDDEEPLWKYSEIELQLNKWVNKKRPEKAEIIIDAFGDFDYKTYKFAPKTDNDEQCYYQELGENNIYCADANDRIYSYLWNKTDLKMTSLEGEQDCYYIENASVRFRVPEDNINKEIMIARQGLYETVHNESTDSWDKSSDKEIFSYDKLKNQEVAEQSYGWFYEQYGSKIDFYLNLDWSVPTALSNINSTYITRVKVGTFYIISDWNNNNVPPQDLIYPINSGIEDVYYLDRMEKCKASQTFCINTDSNIRLGNYRYMPEYAQSEITVFIDPKTMKPYEPNTDEYYRKNGQIIQGNLRVIKQYEVYYKWTRSRAPEYTTLGH